MTILQRPLNCNFNTFQHEVIDLQFCEELTCQIVFIIELSTIMYSVVCGELATAL